MERTRIIAIIARMMNVRTKHKKCSLHVVDFLGRAAAALQVTTDDIKILKCKNKTHKHRSRRKVIHFAAINLFHSTSVLWDYQDNDDWRRHKKIWYSHLIQSFCWLFTPFPSFEAIHMAYPQPCYAMLWANREQVQYVWNINKSKNCLASLPLFRVITCLDCVFNIALLSSHNQR